VLAEWLTEKKGRKVSVLCPERGEKRRLVELANRNAAEAERISTSEEEKRRAEAESLKGILGLKRVPRSIECFDVSNLQGREAVGSMVVFRDGQPDKSSYRHYRIREVKGQDDFAMLAEVFGRRYRHVVERTGSAQERAMPDLVVVDGGRGQLSAARRALKELGVRRCEVVALAKARAGRGGEAERERVFAGDSPRAIPLPEHSYGFRLITRVRDEAHRFAVSYHRRLRRKETMKSPLTDVPGVGPRIAARLMERFGSLDAVAKASVEELESVKGISERLARLIKERTTA